MEKLIELLNEYERPQTNHIYTAYEVKENMNRLDILQEFIKWLVDNDKIDTTNKFLVSVNVENTKNWMGYTKAFEGYESLLMLLAIQDEPIEFLISLLK